MIKSNEIYWQDTLERYKTSKTIRNFQKKYSMGQLTEMTGFTKQYIFNVREMNIKPNEDFIKKLNEVLNGH